MILHLGGIIILSTHEDKVFGLQVEAGRWGFVILGILTYIFLGSVYSWSVFRKPIEEAFSIGATESGLPYMVFLASFAALMPLAGLLMDRIGPRLVTILGGLLVGGGWIAAGYASGVSSLVITYGFLGGAGVGLVYGCPIAVVTKWFPDKKGFAVGLTLAGFGLSPFVMAPISRALIEVQGPFITFRILGALTIVLITLASLPQRFPVGLRLQAGAAKVKVALADLTPREMLSNRRFYALWGCFVFGTVAGLMAIGISSPVGEEVVNMSPQAAALAVSLFAVFNGVGRPLFGNLTDRLSPRVSAITAFAIIIAASLSMTLAGSGSVFLYMISFAAFWLTLGGWLAIAPAATASFFGATHYAKNYGIVYTAYGVAAIIGNMMAGSLRDFFGSYTFVFYPTAAIALLGMIIASVFLKTEAPDAVAILAEIDTRQALAGNAAE